MKKITAIMFAIIFASIAISCKSDRREMPLEDYAKIQAEINIPDPALDPQLVEKVASKYGYSYEEYKDFNDKVEQDQQLREKLGEIRLKSK